VRLATATAVACLAVLLLAGPASASFPAKIDVSVPPGGTATVTSPDLGPTQKSVSVQILGLQPDAVNGLAVFLAGLPTLHARVLGCLYLNESLSALNRVVDDETNSPLLESLFIALCTQVALQLGNRVATPGSVRARSTASACRRSLRQVAVNVTRVAGRYRAHAKGRVQAPKRGLPINVTCRRTPNGLTLRIRPSSPRKVLRGVVGKQLRLGMIAAATAKSSARLQLTFRVP
jgi:hypothetical protein